MARAQLLSLEYKIEIADTAQLSLKAKTAAAEAAVSSLQDKRAFLVPQIEPLMTPPASCEQPADFMNVDSLGQPMSGEHGGHFTSKHGQPSTFLERLMASSTCHKRSAAFPAANAFSERAQKVWRHLQRQPSIMQSTHSGTPKEADFGTGTDWQIKAGHGSEAGRAQPQVQPLDYN